MGACAKTPTGRRDKLAIMTFWVTGMRVRELCALKPGDIARGFAHVTLGDRVVHVPKAHREEIAGYLRAWLKDRKTVAKGESPLFCNLSGGSIEGSYFRRTFAQLASSASIERRFHPQGLRQTYAASLYRGDVPMEAIRRQLGLSDLGYTATWLKQLYPKDAFKAMDSFALD